MFFFSWIRICCSPSLSYFTPDHHIPRNGVFCLCFFLDSPTALLVCNLLFRKKKEIMRLNGVLMCCFPRRCKLLFTANSLCLVSSQYGKIVVFHRPSVISEDLFPLLLESIKFNPAVSKNIVGLLKNKRIVLLWQKACHPKWQEKNVFYAFITLHIITSLQLCIIVLIYTVQPYYYCFLLFIEIKKKNKKF